MVALMSAIVYFEIFCDEEERARKFYSQLFGWKVESIPGTKYCNITTQEGAFGGLTKRFPHQKIINYFGVPSVQQVCSRVEALGGRVLVPGCPFLNFKDHVIAAAILDRILHHCTTVNIKGDSYRIKERRKQGLIPQNFSG